MRYVHPFPARMSPDIVLQKIEGFRGSRKILDPMSGSGTVLAVAARHNHVAIGLDMDPLACLISSVAASRVEEKAVWKALDQLLSSSMEVLTGNTELPWIDEDPETQTFVRYWFKEKQIRQLRALVYFLIARPISVEERVRNVLLVAISRLIITKEPKASLARDTAHSRPHRTLSDNDFDVLEALPKSVGYVLDVLSHNPVKRDAEVFVGDARSLDRIGDGEIDTVITSPPYLNAIDYLRAHKFSLVWFGYRISELREIRKRLIGSERSSGELQADFAGLAKELGLSSLDRRTLGALQRYYRDLCLQLQETARVLKYNGSATYVIGNSTIAGVQVENSELLKKAARLAGLRVVSEHVREIPDSRRYLPIAVQSGNPLSRRIRTEHVITFVKAR